jgi:hypothetical protein
MTKTVTMRVGRKPAADPLKVASFRLNTELIRMIGERSKKESRSAWVRAALWEAVNK